jgi:ribosomal-protein-alanine N-acetyltransferase
MLGENMFIDIETKRLTLKCIDQSDRDFIFEEYQNDFITKYQYDEEPMTDIKEADDLIEFYNMKEPRNQNRWVIIDKNRKNKMGTCGFHLWDKERHEVEIGFELMEKYNGKGYMTEAVEAIIEFAKFQMKVDIIKSFVYVDNDKCKRLVERFGFKKIEKEECVFRGKIYLHDVYEKSLKVKDNNLTTA